MFKSIELENFKAFGERTLIEFAPITLIFGQNSAGKSSILQALSLLKQTRESREPGAPLLPRAEGGVTDLGSFQELLFDHDPSRTLSIGIQIGGTQERFHPTPFRRWLGTSTPESIGLSVDFCRPSLEEEVQVPTFSLACPPLQGHLASFVARGFNDKERELVDDYYWHPSRSRRRTQQRKLRAADCKQLSRRDELWTGIHTEWIKHTDSITKALHSLSEEFAATGFPFMSSAQVEDSTETGEERSKWRDEIQKAIHFYSKPYTLEQFVTRMTSEAQTTVVALDGFIPVSLRPRGPKGGPELVALRYTRQQASPKLPLFDISEVAGFAGHLVEGALESLFPMGPFRRPPERWYIFTGTSPEDVGYRGDLLPDLLFRQPELVKKANAWLERLDIGYALRVRPIGQRGSDLFEMRLVDRRRKKDVDIALSDVGFGISQILPFIVQTLASSEQVISIEQPEVHLHPKLQADLGDLLKTGIEAPYGHQFLVETHSEHLVLRLQRLVRERRLRSTDVSVIFVSRGERGSEARRLRLDDDGRFMDEWPGGFFAERLREFV